MLSILVTQFVVLWAVIDPIGSVPVYLSQTQHLTAKQRRLVALKAIAISMGVLLFFLIAGQLLLEAMQIPLPAFQAAGGLVLLLFALSMIFGESKPEQEQKLGEAELQKAELTAKRQCLLRNVFIAGFILVLLSLLILRHQYVKRLKVQQELSLQREENADQKINQMIKDYRLSR